MQDRFCLKKDTPLLLVSFSFRFLKRLNSIMLSLVLIRFEKTTLELNEVLSTFSISSIKRLINGQLHELNGLALDIPIPK